MTPPLHIFLQERLTRGVTPCLPPGVAMTVFDDEVDLAALDAEARPVRPVVFCSLQNARRIERHCPDLARGVLLPRAFLQHSTYTSYLPQNMLLNETGIYLPWGRLRDHADMLEGIFRQGIFLRPDSPMKPFTGFCATAGRIDADIDHMNRTLRIDSEEMTFVTAKRDLPAIEWRCWIVDGQPVTAAGYSWEDSLSIPGTVPDGVFAAARRVGEILEMREQVYTADFAIMQDTGTCRLVELNALSTSGWYPGLDTAALFAALDSIML